MTDWLAFEQVHGPLLVHERIDLGIALLTFRLVNLFSRKSHRLREFLPPWYDTTSSREGDVLEGFKALFALAEVNDANDQHADG